MSDDGKTAAPDGVDGKSAPAEGGSANGSAYWEQEARKAFAARDEIKQRLKAYEDQSKQAQAAEAKRLAEAGEYKASYEQATAQLAELLPMVDEYKDLREHIASQIDEQRKELPPEYRDLIPEGLPLKAQLAQVDRLRRLASKQQNTHPKVPPASPPTAAGSLLDETDTAARRKALSEMKREDRDKLLKDSFRAWSWSR